MSAITDLVQGIVRDVLTEMLRKTTGVGRRARRRKRALTPTERLSRIEKLLKPSKRQTSRKRTVRSRAKAKRRVG